MKRLRYEIVTANEDLISSYEEIMAAAMIRVESLACGHRYLLKRGWRCIIKMDGHDGVDVTLDLQSSRGGGSFAEVKMATLENIHTDCATTGEDDISFISDLIEEHNLQDTDMGSEICEMLSSQNLSRRHHEWLKDNLNYTNFKGAIRMPYEVLSARLASSDFPREGEMRVAFDGASQEQSVMFCMWIARELQQGLVAKFKKEQFRFCLQGLKAEPTANLWIDLLDIPEVF